ncbi:PIN domain-containing protein [Candidatus Amesbacteria bacterium]|nr:PIN domain-containing protein [Candidatus Amesbacteria bacterium]
MTTIFIDSGPFRAAANKSDDNHLKARAQFEELGVGTFKLMTSDYVVDETYTGLLTRPGYWAAMGFDETLKVSRIKIEFIGQERFFKSQEVFRRFNKDKKWSFTDCTSYVVMKELKIKTVFAFDKNFEEMGFKVL